MRTAIFQEASGDEIWVEGKSSYPDSNILVTLTSTQGESSAYISGGVVTKLQASQLVDAAPEVKVESAKQKYATFQKALTITGYSLAIALLAFSGLTFSGVVKARIVLTGSMEPAISPGDIIVTMPIDRKTPEIGDVVAYQARRFNGEKVAVFSHRIIAGNENEGWVLKGDNNPDPDTQKPLNDDILGVVFFVIPFIGKFLTKEAIMIMAPLAVAIWMAVDTLRGSDEE